MSVVLITRAKAWTIYAALGHHWSGRLRNYEIESFLDANDPAHEHIVAEWCPFNGIHCAWLEHAPAEVIEQVIRYVEEVRSAWEAARWTGDSRYPDPDEHIATLRRALADRQSRA